jgi:tetratricopeptide (TPR) repeat protein
VKKYIIFIAVIIFACLAVYSNTFQCTFHLDDEVSIIRNVAIRHLGDIKTIWDFWPARFITYLTLAFNYNAGVLNVFGYHLFNILIHTAAALFAFWLALLTLATPALKDDKIKGQSGMIALFVGLIFAVHPIQTQGVTYVVQRATSLAGLFYLATLCFYAKSRLSQKGGGIYYAAALATAFLAFFSKEVTLTLPFAILLYEFVFFREGKKMSWKHVVPFLLLIIVIPAVSIITNSYDIKHMKKTSEEPPFATPIQYLFSQFRVIITYVRLLFLPFNQNVDYGYAIEKSILRPPVLAGLALILSLLGSAILLLKRKPLISFCIFWFFVTLMPESSIFPIRDLLFEHRLYITMFGYGLFIASGVYYIFGRKNMRLAAGILIAITLFYSVLAYNRNFVWRDEISLWSDVIKKSPQSSGAYNSRGNAFAAKGDIESAIADYNRSVEILPEYVDVYNNLANAYKRKGDFDNAIANYNKVLKLNPYHVAGHYNRGVALLEAKQLDQAIVDFSNALAVDPRLAEGYEGRGEAYLQKGDVDKALADFKNAAHFSPYFAGAHYMLGTAYTRKSDFDNAGLEFNEAIRLDPTRAEYFDSRGTIYGAKKDLDRAMADFNKAIELNPRFAGAYCNRGNIYLSRGDLNAAIADFDKTIEADPRYLKAYGDRAVAHFLKKEYQKSWEDVKTLESFGANVNPKFVDDLKKALGKE